MRWLGPTATNPDDLMTKSEVQALIAAGSGSSGAAAFGIQYGETRAMARFLLSLGLINSLAVPIVFAGDSITRGYKTGSTIATKPYVTRFYDRLVAAFPKDSGSHPALTVTTSPAAHGTLSAGINLFNCGISSTKSDDYFNSTMRTAVGATNPRAVFHNVGTNDYRYFGIPVATFKTNVQAVIADLKTKIAGPCVHVLLHHYGTLTCQAGMPVAPWSDYGQAKREIAAADPDNVAFIDLAGMFSSIGIQLAGGDPFGLLADNIHPTEDGHLVLGDACYLAALGGP